MEDKSACRDADGFEDNTEEGMDVLDGDEQVDFLRSCVGLLQILEWEDGDARALFNSWCTSSDERRDDRRAERSSPLLDLTVCR